MSVGGSGPRPPSFSPSYYYDCDEFVFSIKCVSLLSKKSRNSSKCSAFATSALFYLFFTSNSAVFVDRGRKNDSCPRAQSTLATPMDHCPPAADAHGRPLWTVSLGLGLELTEIHLNMFSVKRPSGQVSVQKCNNFCLAGPIKYFQFLVKVTSITAFRMSVSV